MREPKEIHEEMLSEIDNSYSKEPGEFIWDATKPVADQIAKLEAGINNAISKFLLENLEGDELEQRINERTGQTRKKATFSIGSVFVEGNGTVHKGDLFETESGIQFEATEQVLIDVEGFIPIKCSIAGTIGNVPASRITKIPITINGITSVSNPEPTKDGFNAESDDDLLERYYERIKTPSTSGNKYHYINWAKEVEGVGEAKVFPTWAGPNTVKVVVVNAERRTASNDLINNVVNYIEENRPIGAEVTVISGSEKVIDLSATIVLANGYTISQVQSAFEENIAALFKEIAFKESYVSYANIGNILFNIPGVGDYSSLIIQNGVTNVLLDDEEVPVLGSVTLEV